MQIKIIAYGITKEILGNRMTLFEIPDHVNTISDLKVMLQEKFPRLKSLNSLAYAINEEYADDETLLSQADEIVLIPPVSGG